MSKSKSGGSSSDGSDGRRNNKTPDKSKIKPDEVRNPYGRYGKRGKPPAVPLTSIDQWYLEEAARVVSHDANGEVCAGKRMVQEECLAALFDKDENVRRNVRNRTIDRISLSSAKYQKDLREFEEWFWTCKSELSEDFAQARATGRQPPDAAHPDHVHWRGDSVVFTGPLDRAARRQWEHLKAIIKIAAHLHRKAREQYRLDPSEEHRIELSLAEAHRRKVMRNVPKGWDWREDIYCRYSWTKHVQETIAALECRS